MSATINISGGKRFELVQESDMRGSLTINTRQTIATLKLRPELWDRFVYLFYFATNAGVACFWDVWVEFYYENSFSAEWPYKYSFVNNAVTAADITFQRNAFCPVGSNANIAAGRPNTNVTDNSLQRTMVVKDQADSLYYLSPFNLPVQADMAKLVLRNNPTHGVMQSYFFGILSTN